MSDVRKRIEESQNIVLYKHLLNMFGEFCNKFPMSSVDRLFQRLCDGGAKIIPKDKRALDILSSSTGVNPEGGDSGVQGLLNKRFSELTYCVRPTNKAGRRHEVAYWCRDGQVYDKVINLINFDGNSGKGFWSDAEGKKVELLDTTY